MKRGPSDELPGNDRNTETPSPTTPTSTPTPATMQQQSRAPVFAADINLSSEFLFFHPTSSEEAEFTALWGLTVEGITGAVNYTQCEIATSRRRAICLAWQSLICGSDDKRL